jgi:hypothetical protein
LHINNLIEIC